MLRSSGMVRAALAEEKIVRRRGRRATGGHGFSKIRPPSGRRSLNYFDIHGIGIAFCDAAVSLIARLCGAGPL